MTTISYLMACEVQKYRDLIKLVLSIFGPVRVKDEWFHRVVELS